MKPTRLARLAAAILIAVPALAGAQKVDGKPVEAPHYGDTLFHFYQGKYFTSVTGLMASQFLARVYPHEDDAEVLRGGLLLSYGLHDEAGRIFAALIEQNTKPAVRDRAWFYLAKIRYQRERYAEAEAALDRIGAALPKELEEDRALLRANVLMARNEPARAADALAGLVDGKTDASRFARFNLGVALLAAGNVPRGRAILEVLGKEGADKEELRVLRDRANVALGFSQLQDGEYEAARKSLERVRLASANANKALLGFGWAAASLEQHDKALVPWTELVGREGADAAILEARIALPYAYAELGATGQALARYEDAIAVFEREQKALDESIAAIGSGKLETALLERNPGEEMGWFWAIGALPEMPHPSHLAPLLAGHEFQEAFKNYRDLRFLERNLANWREQLVVYGDMLANRRAGYSERLPKVLQQARDITLAPLEAQRKALAAELAAAEKASDGIAFADAREQALIERLARVRESIAQLGESADDGQRQRARLAQGALTWELARAQSDRRWQAAKALRDLDAGIAEAKQRVEAIAAAQREEPARHAAFAERIAALGKRIEVSLPVVTALAKEQQGEVQSIAVAALRSQQERIAAYTTQARFAVAQLYDRAQVSSRSTEGDDAPKRP